MTGSTDPYYRLAVASRRLMKAYAMWWAEWLAERGW
jgi:hypothetical protein